jgi:hypothetical protein
LLLLANKFYLIHGFHLGFFQLYFLNDVHFLIFIILFTFLFLRRLFTNTMLAEFILQFSNLIAVVFDNLMAFEKTFAHIAIKLLHAIGFVFLS